MKDIVVRVEIYIPPFRANSPRFTSEGRYLSPGKGDFRNGRCASSSFSLREHVSNQYSPNNTGDLNSLASFAWGDSKAHLKQVSYFSY